ncbi:DUF4142 domain-containing protein [Chitinophaga varians]|uniref:DUF4142 domain-containing protein n=1 Tax=Chitinophaga varians TaxID=2202339 RepID=UPI00165FFFFD|nr:DUF4142 domain-containing protein [Chitinophaga varians]MBC9910225.1 DUF4142 domain-containing protein [Chitinophaga varians]
MKKITFFAAAWLGIGMLSFCGNNTKNGPQHTTPADSAEAINKTDKTVDSLSASFAVNVMDDGMMEVALGKLALEKATDPRVKAFATMSVNDRTRINDELKAIAEKRKIALPSDISAAAKKFIDKLSRKSGKFFEKEYIAEMEDNHERDVKDFDNAANNLESISLREWARKTLPTVMTHLDSARAIKDAQ